MNVDRPEALVSGPVTEGGEPPSVCPGNEAAGAACFTQQKQVATTPVAIKLSSPEPLYAPVSPTESCALREITKVSQWHIFQEKNKHLFLSEKEFFTDIERKVKDFAEVEVKLDRLLDHEELDGSRKFKKLIKILGHIYLQSHLDKIKNKVVKKAVNAGYINDINRMLAAWGKYHLKQLNVLLLALADNSRNFFYGNLPESSLLIEVIQDLQGKVGPCDLATEIRSTLVPEEGIVRQDRRSFEELLSVMQRADMMSSIVQYETQYIEPVAQAGLSPARGLYLDNTRDVRFAQSARRILWNANFVPLKNLCISHFNIINQEGFGGGLMVTKSIAGKLDEFFQRHDITQLVHLFAGMGMLQAALKSVNSKVAVTSVDTYFGNDMLKPQQDGSKQAVFYREYDQDGVVIEKYWEYLSAHRSLITANSCLLVSFPGLQDESLKSLQQALRCWGLLQGGLIIVLSEVVDKSLIYGGLFTGGGLRKKENSILLPPEFVRAIPHITPEIFTIELAGKTVHSSSAVPSAS